ncbi:reverse transcriptase domain-containing protein [Tanacetum coccineum]
MESKLHTSKCSDNSKVEYTACLLQGRALTWWNTQVQTRGCEAALRLTWEEFKNLLLKEYYPKSEVQKLESEFWNHTMRISVSIALERHLEEIHVTWDQFRKRNWTRWQMGMKTELKNEDQRVETSSIFIVTPSGFIVTPSRSAVIY